MAIKVINHIEGVALNADDKQALYYTIKHPGTKSLEWYEVDGKTLSVCAKAKEGHYLVELKNRNGWKRAEVLAYDEWSE